MLLIHSFWHPRGGDTTSLAMQREALVARGHDVVPFGTRHPDNCPELGDAGWPGWRDPGSRSALPGAVWSLAASAALRRVLRGSAPFDVAHIHHLHRHLTPSILPVLRGAGVRVVWTLHDYELSCPTAHHYRAGKPCFECAGGATWPALRHRCSRLGPSTWDAVALVAEKQVYRAFGALAAVDVFIAPSRYLADRMKREVPPDRIVHVPNPVRLPAVLASGPRAGVVFAGRLVEEKGVHDVLAIAQALPSVAFTLLGDGPLLGQVRASGLRNVEARGAVRHEEVVAALAAAAAVLVPSRWPENDPYAVTEAQAAGATVLASRIGGIPEQIEHGVDGLLCPPSEPAAWVRSLAEVLGDEVAAVEMGERARLRVAQARNPDRIAIALEAVYTRSRS